VYGISAIGGDLSVDKKRLLDIQNIKKTVLPVSTERTLSRILEMLENSLRN